MLLSLLLIPLAIALLLPLLPGDGRSLRTVSGLGAGLQAVLATALALNPVPDLRLPWLPPLGLDFHLGADGISRPLVLLTAIITVAAIAASASNTRRPRLYFALLLVTNAALVGSFLAQNALLFLIAYELLLIPAYLLISIWGGAERGAAASRFLLFGAVSGVALFAGILGLGLLGGGVPSFEYADLARQSLAPVTQAWLLLLLGIGFGIKLPLLPLHGWQPLTYSQTSTPVVMLLAGAMSKLGAYGLLRFGLQFLPQAWSEWAPTLAVLGAVTAVYGALNAIAQPELKRLVAYSSLGHMGTLVLALAAATPLSLQGAIAQMIAHGLIVALLFLLVGLVQTHAGTTEIAELSGLMNPYRGLPFTMGLLLLALMASAGLPGLAGFVAEFLVYQGSWTVFPLPTLACLLASGLTAVYCVRLFNRVGFGRLDNARADYSSTTLAERLPAVALAVLIALGGLWPQALVGWSEPESQQLAQRSPLPTSPLAPDTRIAHLPALTEVLLP